MLNRFTLRADWPSGAGGSFPAGQLGKVGRPAAMKINILKDDSNDNVALFHWGG